MSLTRQFEVGDLVAEKRVGIVLNLRSLLNEYRLWTRRVN